MARSPLLVVAATRRELEAALGRKVAAAPQGAAFAAEAYGRSVMALVTGVGMLNAALALGRALAGRGVSGVLNPGVAGSYDPAGHPLRAVRLVNRAVWPEYGLLADGGSAADARGLGFALWGAGEEAVFDRLEWDAPASLGRMGLAAQGWKTAAAVSVSGVSADASRAARLRERYGAALEDMEGFALAYGCRLAALPFAGIRAVSNAAGARPPRDWDLSGALAALGGAVRRLFSADAA